MSAPSAPAAPVEHVRLHRFAALAAIVIALATTGFIGSFRLADSVSTGWADGWLIFRVLSRVLSIFGSFVFVVLITRPPTTQHYRTFAVGMTALAVVWAVLTTAAGFWIGFWPTTTAPIPQ